LPTEAEWEHAAADLPVAGNLREQGEFGPAAAKPHQGLRQMFGDAWEWTRSAYAPYPGFRPAAGAIGEYNGKFMIGQMVLRGGCCATPEGHVRATYRNFFYPHQRWMFSGVRLAWDGGGDDRTSSEFERDVVVGLSKPQKALPAKYFYDAEGSRLFEQITELPEYYPTRTELALMRAKAGEMAEAIPDGAALVEFGSGASVKTRVVLKAAPQLGAYVPVDIAGGFIAEEAERLRRDFPRLAILPVAADFTKAFPLPEAVRGKPLVGFFPGSTIGNFDPADARDFLAHAARMLGARASMLVGVDLDKAPDVLNAAYNDRAGVTAAFNLNLLTRINRELDGNFDLRRFRHRAFYNPERHRVEMHLASLVPQQVKVCGRSFDFAAGETIHTECSYKYTLASFAALAREAGWRPARAWTDPDGHFSVHVLQLG